MSLFSFMSTHPVQHSPQGTNASRQGSGEEIPRQVVSTPEVECMPFNGDPIRYVSFMHNFEPVLINEFGEDLEF